MRDASTNADSWAECRAAWIALNGDVPVEIERAHALEVEVAASVVETSPSLAPTPTTEPADVPDTHVAILYYSPEALYVSPRAPFTFRHEPVGQVISGKWSDLCRWLAKSAATDPTLEPDTAKKARGAWVGGTWAEPVRRKKSENRFVATSIVIIDIDGGDPHRLARVLGNHATCIHSTATHLVKCEKNPNGAPRCRLALLCSRPITTARDYGIVHGAVRDRLRARGFVTDDGAHDVGRLNYLPMHGTGVTPVHIVTTGKPLDVDRILGAVPSRPAEHRRGRPSARNPSYITSALRNEAERVLDARSGDRHNQNFRSSASLARDELGLDDDTILDALLRPAERADPEEDHDELERTIRDGFEAGRAGGEP